MMMLFAPDVPLWLVCLSLLVVGYLSVPVPRTWIPGELVTAGMMNGIRDLFLSIEAGGAEMVRVLLVGDTSANLVSLEAPAGHAAIAYDTDVAALVASLDGGDYQALGTKGLHELYIPALAMRPLSTGGCGTIEDATSTNTIAGLPFDPTTSEGAYFWIQLPKAWDRGTVTAKFSTFNKAGGSGGFVFSLAGTAISDDESISAALGTAQQVTDTILTAYDAQISAATAAITIAGTPAVGDWILFVIKRLTADGGDTYGSDVFLQGVQLTLTTDAENDA